MSFPLIFLLGPTAVGKTNCSFYLAQKLSASILNCDSIQMYKGLDIGSDKPVLYLKQKKIPMFLFDILEAPSTCTAGQFRQKALEVLKTQSHNCVLAVGGSGFYIQALEKGMYPIKNISPDITKSVTQIKNKKGLEYLYNWLKKLDPLYAQKIYPQDNYRIFRALCIILSEKKPLSEVQSTFKTQKLPYPCCKIGLYLPRETLLKNVQIRTQQMLKNGLLEEVEFFINKKLLDWPPLSSTGYKECVLFLQNKLSKEELKQRIINRTMQLVKKQMSWFKRDKSIKWYLSTESQKQKIYEQINIFKGELLK